MLDDFNTCLGSRLCSVLYDCVHCVDGMDGGIIFFFFWRSALGSFGLGPRNQAGEDFLVLCTANNLSIRSHP